LSECAQVPRLRKADMQVLASSAKTACDAKFLQFLNN
jgi:hypothetical protein